MCLYVKRVSKLLGAKPNIAQHDIPCYKIVILKELLSVKHYWPVYYGKEIPLEVINGEKDYYADKQELPYNKLLIPYDSNEDEVHGGYIHTHGTAESTDLEQCCLDKEEDYRIFKCIIPKGTEYFEGKYMLNISYASRKIRFVKEIDYKELEKELEAELNKEKENAKP